MLNAKKILKEPIQAHAKPTSAPSKWPTIWQRVEIAWAPQHHKHSVFFVYFVAAKIRKLFLGFITTNGANTKR